MALPIWALFYKKCLMDGTVGISANDKFVIPSDIDVSCKDGFFLGGDNSEYTSEGEEQQVSEEYYFN